MTEHHHKEETYFGEDYYDEDAEESVNSSMARQNPYAEADRLNKLGKKNPVTFHREYHHAYDEKAPE